MTAPAARTGWWLSGLILLLGTLSVPVLTLRMRTFQGDESTYYTMALSLAYDADLKYQAEDLHRVYRDFPDGPQGLFLIKGKGDQLYYAKSYIYPLCVAPFVRLFGANGFLVFNVGLLWLCWGLAHTWLLRRGWSPTAARWVSLGFLVASVLPAYSVWFTPEVFNFAMVFLSLWAFFAALESTVRRRPLWLVLSGISAGLAIFSKPPNIVILAIFGLAALLQRRWREGLMSVTLGVLVVLGLFAVYYEITGQWNFQGGLRKTFYSEFPYAHAEATFEKLGIWHSADITYGQEFYLDARTLVLDIFYYFFGRYAGILWYFTPAIVGLGQALIHRGRRNILLLLGFSLTVLLFILTQPNNYLGGGGTLANRYFTSAYPWTFFMFTQVPRLAQAVVTLCVAAMFAGPVLVDPFLAARSPWRYAQTSWHRFLPLEFTVLENLPSNTYPHAFHKPFPDARSPQYFAYFLDDGFYPKEQDGFWVKGGRATELVLKRKQPFTRVAIVVRNGPQPGQVVDIRVGRHHRRVPLGPQQTWSWTLERPGAHRIRDWWMLPMRIGTRHGFTPAFVLPGSRDRRYLGVFVRITVPE